MARPRSRGRARSTRKNANGNRTPGRGSVQGGVDASVVPRMLLGTVDRVGIVAVGALQFARDVLLSAVSGAADIGSEALTATVAGARGVVSAASRMVGDVAGSARSTVLTTIDNARHSRGGPARLTPGRSRSTAEAATAPSEAPR